MTVSIREPLKKISQKAKVPFIEPLLASAMMLERHIDATIKEVSNYGFSQFKILVSIEKASQCKQSLEVSQTNLADFWGVSEAAISRQVTILEHDKLLARTQDPIERRRVLLKLTTKGKIFVRKTMHHIDKELNTIFKKFSANKKSNLNRDLNIISETLSIYIHQNKK